MSQKTVLVVEDEIGVLEVLVLVLEGAGYRVVTAGNGREGLAKVRDAPPDLVITDFMMPGMSGPEMVHAMAADGSTDVPAILISAVPDAALAQHPDLFAASLRKPFRLAQLLAAVDEALGNPA